MGKAKKSTRQERMKTNRLVVIQNDTMLHANKTQNKKMLELYSTEGNIVTIGDGDFSFSLALAVELNLKRDDGSSRLVATSFDTLPQVLDKYPSVSNSIASLSAMGMCVLHGVDGTNLPETIEAAVEKSSRRPGYVPVPSLIHTCGRVIFNFPHIGGATEEDTNANRNMLKGFFSSVRQLLTLPVPPQAQKDQKDKNNDHLGGQVHVALRTTSFYRAWKLDELAAEYGLIPLRKVPFVAAHYPGYTEQRTNPGIMRAAPQADGAEITVYVLDMTHAANRIFAHVKPTNMTISGVQKPSHATTTIDGSKFFVPEVQKGGIVIGQSSAASQKGKMTIKKTTIAVLGGSKTAISTAQPEVQFEPKSAVILKVTPAKVALPVTLAKFETADSDEFDFNEVDFIEKVEIPSKQTKMKKTALVQSLSSDTIRSPLATLENENQQKVVKEQKKEVEKSVSLGKTNEISQPIQAVQQESQKKKTENPRNDKPKSEKSQKVKRSLEENDNDDEQDIKHNDAAFGVQASGTVSQKGLTGNSVAPAYLRNTHPSSRPTVNGVVSINMLEAFGRGQERDQEYAVQAAKRKRKEEENQKKKWEKSHPVRHDLFQVEAFNNGIDAKDFSLRKDDHRSKQKNAKSDLNVKKQKEKMMKLKPGKVQK